MFNFQNIRFWRQNMDVKTYKNLFAFKEMLILVDKRNHKLIKHNWPAANRLMFFNKQR